MYASGWWKLDTKMSTDDDKQSDVELDDADCKHIAEMISQGYNQGELLREEN